MLLEREGTVEIIAEIEAEKEAEKEAEAGLSVMRIAADGLNNL